MTDSLSSAPLLPSLSTLVLPLPPSSIAFSPLSPSHLVIGTYLLSPGSSTSDPTPASQSRTGTISHFLLSAAPSLTLLATLPCPSGAVLDLAFSPHRPSLLLAATSAGSLASFTLSPPGPLTASAVLQPFAADVLVLDVAFHPALPDVVGATLSSGGVALVSLQTGGVLVEVSAHALEAWTLAFTASGAVVSGGDDAVLRLATLEPGGQGEEGVVVVDRRSHGAGVTAILPLLEDDAAQTLLTGSYDDRIRVVVLRQGRRADVKAELDLGGGVWRLALMHAAPGRWTVLASCMYAGARVVRVTSAAEGEWRIEVLARFEEHQSMNYGSDVQPVATGQATGGKRTVVTSSFYDKLVCVWEVDVGP